MTSLPHRCRVVGFLALALSMSLHGASLNVAPHGDDANDGSASRPLRTIEAARDSARRAGAGPHEIVLQPGDYFLTTPVIFDHRDSGLTIAAEKPGTALVYGGRALTGWRREGDAWWAVDLPEVKAGQWDFRALVVNGRLAERARLPAKGALQHRSTFDVMWQSTVGGGWARKPTNEELTTLRYDPADLPASFEPRNAEVRIYHMWDESLVGVSGWDPATNTLRLAPAAKSPPGAFGVKKYIVFNTREGMTHPGQWYLDRAAGRLVYWPLPGEDMTRAQIVAPVVEQLLVVRGTKGKPVVGFTLRGVSLRCTNTPLQPGGFGAYGYEGALALAEVKNCRIEAVEITGVGGQGIKGTNLDHATITGSHLHHLGACALKLDGHDGEVVGNHIHDVGLYHPSAIAVALSHAGTSAGEKGFHFARNQIHDAPYSGVNVSGQEHVLEENLISAVMQEMQDGAAIYGMMRHCLLRRNVVRGVVKVGEGYGVSAYYFDEGSEDSVLERNVSIGVERPTHNHMARRLTIRDNVFIADRDLVLSFQRSGRITFTGNTLVAPGKVKLDQPNAISVWADNVVYHDGLDAGGRPQAFTIDDAQPTATPPARRKETLAVARTQTPPVIDGQIGDAEWPGRPRGIDRELSGWSAAGAAAFVRFLYDDTFLYVAVHAAVFDVSQVHRGRTWGADDGAELAVGTADGTYVLRGYAGGASESLPVGGVTADHAERLGAGVRIAAQVFGRADRDYRSGWKLEWAIPWASLGVAPKPGLKLPVNVSLYRAEDGAIRCLDATRAESWRVGAVTLELTAP